MDSGALHAQAQLLAVSQALLKLLAGARIAFVIHDGLRQIDGALNRELSLAKCIRLLCEAGKFATHRCGVSLPGGCLSKVDLGNKDHVWFFAVQIFPRRLLLPSFPPPPAFPLNESVPS